MHTSPPAALVATDARASLAHYLAEGYAAYTYAYPHKSAYRQLARPVPLNELWQTQARDDLFLYVHIPFCHYRCGFCNLFALGAPRPEWVEAFLASLQRQIAVTAAALGPHRITRMAIGGGTPSYLTVVQFETLLASLQRHFNLQAPGRSFAIEIAPDSATPDRLSSYRRAGVTRISMGVQSFVDQELDALARPHQRDAVLRAVQQVRELEFPTLNLDLIYGIQGQTRASFQASLDSVLALDADELYLYPLYVRRLTGLAKAARTQGLQQRATLYQDGVERLQAAAFTQSSMRFFRRARATLAISDEFACQSLGTVGLGVGARSYTRALHYSEEYAVSRGASQTILQAYNARSAEEFAYARFGFELDASERRRRYLLQSLLMWPGLDLTAYREQFSSAALVDFPQLQQLLDADLAICSQWRLALTAAGMAQADAIGPWLYSDAVRAQMQAYDWR